ncbi:MAG: hypothetical protein CSA36_01105 [Draconibacterium sp.]|nr:MAG: hypothetical protein CSA36_01105 [Draconibacterium sp.]
MSDLITDFFFDIGKTSNYKLSIQVCLDGFSFSVFSPEENKIVAFKNSARRISNPHFIAQHFDEWIKSNELLRKDFLEITILFFTDEFALIPENFHSKSLITETERIIARDDTPKSIQINTIKGLTTKTEIAFYFPSNLKKVIDIHFSNALLCHSLQFVLPFLPQQKNKANQVLVIYLKKSCLVVCSKRGEVLLANGITVGHENDLVYSVMNTLKQVGFASSDTDFYLAEAAENQKWPEELFRACLPEITYLQPRENASLVPQTIHRYFPTV